MQKCSFILQPFRTDILPYEINYQTLCTRTDGERLDSAWIKKIINEIRFWVTYKIFPVPSRFKNPFLTPTYFIALCSSEYPRSLVSCMSEQHFSWHPCEQARLHPWTTKIKVGIKYLNFSIYAEKTAFLYTSVSKRLLPPIRVLQKSDRNRLISILYSVVRFSRILYRLGRVTELSGYSLFRFEPLQSLRSKIFNILE